MKITVKQLKEHIRQQVREAFKYKKKNRPGDTLSAECLECGAKFKSSSPAPTCPKCKSSDVELAEAYRGGWPPPGWHAKDKDKEGVEEEVQKESPLGDRLSRGVRNILSPKEDSFVRDFVNGRIQDLPRSLMSKLMNYYRDEMPYGTQKGRDGDPYEWLRDEMEPLYADATGHGGMIDSITKVSDAVRRREGGVKESPEHAKLKEAIRRLVKESINAAKKK